MNNKSVLAVSAMLLIAVFSFLAIPVSKQQDTWEVGVKVGDWAKYGDVRVSWHSNHPEVRPDPELLEANNTVWFQLTVLRVYETEAEIGVSFQYKVHFKNETESERILYVDLYSGFGNASLLLIPGNLYALDPVYFGYEGEDLIYINETVTRTYLGASRTANRVNITLTPSPPIPGSDIRASIDYYWDAATGVLTERVGSYYNSTGTHVTSWSRSDRIIDTSLWESTPTPQPQDGNTSGSADGNWIWIVLIGIPAGFTITAILVWMRKSSSKTVRYRHRPKRR